MFQLAIDAGHYLQTPGKRIPASLDKNQTREWWLNNRLAQYIERFAPDYGMEVRRVDDTTGKTLVGLQERCDKANDWKADFYLSIHHNAGIDGGAGGGIVAYSYKGSTKNSPVYRDAIYNACIAAGGLKGNRAKPLQEADFHVLKYTKMPAVLMEYGFMDSKTDAPMILTDSYAKKMAEATVAAIAQVAGLAKSAEAEGISLPVLRKGDKGEQVRAMQSLLITRGFPCGKQGTDGSFGGNTQSALSLCQSKGKLDKTGVCDEKTWRYLLGV